jgi:Fe-S-cluster containining protein
MNHRDETEQFLNSLPEIKDGDSFRFACHPAVQCFNACCGDLTLQLTPYDVLRLRKGLNLSSKDFIEGLAEVMVAPDTGFPALKLRMTEREHRPCHFVRESGCSVYENRPGACRTYPVGRAAKLGGDGNIVEQYFLVREPHCKGFREEKEWTIDEWFADQGLEPYNASNDRWISIMARQKQTGRPLSAKHATMVLMAVYQVDNFQRFIRDMQLFKRLDVNEERQKAILEHEETALEFAMDWVELVLFGACAYLAKTNA